VGERQEQPFHLSLNGRLRVDFRGARVLPNGGLLLVRELDERLGLGELFERHLTDSRAKNTPLPLANRVRQSVYSRLAGYEDVNDAERLSQDPAFWLIGSEKVLERRNGIRGYDAGLGFDLVSGWGTPDFAALVAAFPGASAAVSSSSTTIPAGATVNAGQFTVTNTTGTPLTLGSVGVTLSSANIFSKLPLTAAVAGVSSSSVKAVPAANTVFMFTSPVAKATPEGARPNRLRPRLALRSRQELAFDLALADAMLAIEAKRRVEIGESKRKSRLEPGDSL
jgi:hypothetical protein